MKEAIILFTRVPVPGKTKTRLQEIFSPNECARLHTCFLMDIKNCYERSGKDCFVFYAPEGKAERLFSILGEEVSYFVQQGETLGDRMYNGISKVLEMGYQACVLIGSDIPEIQPLDLQEAFEVLKSKDVVFGPTLDYGYYLVGMKKAHKAVFERQTYGYGSVLQNTVAAVKAAQLTYGLIRARRDIDESEDVLNYKNKVDTKEISGNTHTAKYVAQLALEHGEKWNALMDYESM